MKKFVTAVVLSVCVLIAYPWPIHHGVSYMLHGDPMDVVDTLYKHDTIFIVRDTVYIDLTKQQKVSIL